MQKIDAKSFVETWKGRGDEKQDAQSYWRDLLVVLGAQPSTLSSLVSFERKVPGGFIDVFIEDTGVLVEQKSLGVDLEKKQLQSDGEMLTPYEQGARYASRLPLSIRPRWIISCNFERMFIYDQETDPTGENPSELLLEDLPKELYRLSFILDKSNSRIEKEKELSVKAGEIVGKLYKSFAVQYNNLETDRHEQKSLNMLIVRLVFLLYAEDAGLLQNHGALYDYLKPFPPEQMRRAVIELFQILDTPEGERDPYAREDLLAFPYINGGLFADEDVVIPQFTDQIKLDLLLEASSKFDWSEVSPTIFGAVFESTLNPETRRAGGMHYTSIENIHKVIDPLFLDDLKAELAAIEGLKTERDRKIKLKAYQQKLASLNIFDPACGSGNFLTESYLSLRKLENRALENLLGGQRVIGFDDEFSPIRVSIDQFYGIEINDFAVSVAKTALWIAESQMVDATQEIILQTIDYLPLSSNNNIVEGNALRVDWNNVLPAGECSFICGNPPFLGYSNLNDEQKKDRAAIFGGVSTVDYVACWYAKASEYTKGHHIKSALVSTNSICQGQQVKPIWDRLFEEGNHIDFAWRTFVWNNEATDQAHVHCVIVGFSREAGIKPRIFTEDGEELAASNINGYLEDKSNVSLERRTKPICDVLPMVRGCGATDGGNLILEPEEREKLVRQCPEAENWIKPFSMGAEFINGKNRYCLWLVGITQAELDAMPPVKERVEAVRQMRLESKKAPTRKKAETPWLFDEVRPPEGESYIAVPKVSSGRREYVPMGFVTDGMIPGDKLFYISNAGLYEFGVLESQFHNAWIRSVAGRLKSDYSYSNTIVYNNFIWPDCSPEQRENIEVCAQAVLDARGNHPDLSLADLYDPDKMPGDLRAAHTALDKAVEEAYGVDFEGDEEKIVSLLFELRSRFD